MYLYTHFQTGGIKEDSYSALELERRRKQRYLKTKARTKEGRSEESKREEESLDLELVKGTAMFASGTVTDWLP